MPLTRRVCPICGHHFTPSQWKQRHCSERQTGRTCANISRSLILRGLIPTAAIQGHRHHQRERARAAIRAQFGPLSDRDVDLVRRALKTGWQRGYDAARKYFTLLRGAA
jgi:hypothetical protein